MISQSLRSTYSELGVEQYYSSNLPYSNPHAKEVIKLLTDNHHLYNLDNVLDLSCGDGLVTKTLISLGYNQITGCDPYLHDRYIAETSKTCLKMSFLDIVKHGLQERYSTIISSFALHLCEKSLLPALIYRLGEVTNTLIVISPSKHPIINLPKEEMFVYTKRNKRVHMRSYSTSSVLAV